MSTVGGKTWPKAGPQEPRGGVGVGGEEVGGELTFLSEAEAGGKTGPPGALRGRAEAAQKLRLQGEILAPPPTATGRGGQIPTPTRVQPQHPAQRGPGADGWQGARPPAGPFGEPGWGGSIRKPVGPGLLTLVLEVLQDGDDGLQGDVVGQEELPGAVLLEGFPVQALDFERRRGDTLALTHAHAPRTH